MTGIIPTLGTFPELLAKNISICRLKEYRTIIILSIQCNDQETQNFANF